jgi:uncharacterized protein (DUF302 family)
MTAPRNGLLPVGFGRPGQAHPFQRAIVAGMPFEATLASIRAVLSELDLWIIHEIDPQMLLQRAGYAIDRTRQILFFHPRYMVRVLAADPSALPEAPLKIVVMEGAEDVTVRWPEPEAHFARYGDDRLAKLGRELGLIYATIAARLAK